MKRGTRLTLSEHKDDDGNVDNAEIAVHGMKEGLRYFFEKTLAAIEAMPSEALDALTGIRLMVKVRPERKHNPDDPDWVIYSELKGQQRNSPLETIIEDLDDNQLLRSRGELMAFLQRMEDDPSCDSETFERDRASALSMISQIDERLGQTDEAIH